MHRNALEQSVTYQKLVKQSLEEGREEGKLEGLRQAVMDVVQEHFPEIVAFAQKEVEGMEDLTLLRQLNVKMGTAQTIQEAIQLLIAADNNAKKE